MQGGISKYSPIIELRITNSIEQDTVSTEKYISSQPQNGTKTYAVPSDSKF